MCFCHGFAPQNEPTFYTTDGTPFTAADPGEYRQRLQSAATHIQTDLCGLLLKNHDPGENQKLNKESMF